MTLEIQVKALLFYLKKHLRVDSFTAGQKFYFLGGLLGFLCRGA